MLTLKFEKRKQGEGQAGKLKAVYYGAKVAPEAVFVGAIDFEKLYREVGKSSVLTLEGEGKKLQAMVQEIAYDPVRYEPNHIDFYIVEKGVKIDTEVPLSFIGVAEAVKTLGGQLVKVLHELHIEAEANNLPHTIEVDISALTNLDSVIKVKDIILPKGVSLYRVEEEAIVASVAQAVEEDLSTPTEVDISSVEIAEKGKKEEETETQE